MVSQAKSLPHLFLSMFRQDLLFTAFLLSFIPTLQADKLVTFVYKLNGDEVKVDKSHYPK
jgi:hypothetical protein